jgi:hypothetical protein
MRLQFKRLEMLYLVSNSNNKPTVSKIKLTAKQHEKINDIQNNKNMTTWTKAHAIRKLGIGSCSSCYEIPTKSMSWKVEVL